MKTILTTSGEQFFFCWVLILVLGHLSLYFLARIHEWKDVGLRVVVLIVVWLLSAIAAGIIVSHM